MIGGVLLYLIYDFLYQNYRATLISYLPQILGKYIGWMVGLFYVLYFLYLGGRVLRDFGIMMEISILRNTPLFIVNLVMLIMISYAMGKGIEVLGRLAEFFFIPNIVFGSILISILFFLSGLVELAHLQPVLANGWKPVLKTVFPNTLTFPFGEMIAFAMILPSLNQKEETKKIGIIGILFSGLFISYVMVIMNAVLGVNEFQISFFPLISAVGLIEIEFIARLDAIAVILLYVGVFFKIAVFYYAALIGAKELFRVKKEQQLILPIGIIILISSYIIADDAVEHFKEGLELVPLYLHVPFQIVIPILLLLFTLLKKKLVALPFLKKLLQKGNEQSQE